MTWGKNLENWRKKERKISNYKKKKDNRENTLSISRPDIHYLFLFLSLAVKIRNAAIFLFLG